PVPHREDPRHQHLVRRAGELLPRIALCRELGRVPHVGVLCAIGTRRPLPNAFIETFRPGAACFRLYSARSTCEASFGPSAFGPRASRGAASTDRLFSTRPSRTASRRG